MAPAASSLTVFLLLLLVASPLNMIIAVEAAGGGGGGEEQQQLMMGWMMKRSAAAAAESRCQGKLGECNVSMIYGAVDEEDDTTAEEFISRRILQQDANGAGYISYDALKRNTVPCSMRGASYYNCQAGAEANPYNRGCSAITRCRS